MFRRKDEEPNEGMEWCRGPWLRTRAVGEGRDRAAGSEARTDLTVQRELETRHLLAEVVYRVPDVWLDEVLRVRMADLAR